MQVSLKVNGKSYDADVEPRMLLVDFLRDTLGLTGTKVGCDTSQCGSCNILLNGKSAKSCAVLAVQADGSNLVTIEGVAMNGQLHLLQEGFQEAHGLQCGFCTPGIIMSLLDFLQNCSNPSEADIRNAIDGNLCRCTGYQNIIKAVQYTVERMQQPPK
jgi:carbon-monoxide dehydrogenase small subunit